MQDISKVTILEKYAKGNELTADDIYKRVAKGVASVEKTEELKKKYEIAFYENMLNGAIGAGRIMSNAGTNVGGTLINCFVQPVGDSITGLDEDGDPGIYDSITKAAETMRRGGGVGYNFSKIRPKGSYVKGTSSFASGPCSYINVFDASCDTVESAGARRGAQLAALNIDHPDILEFITAKRTPGRWNKFNVSVFVSDKFMEAKNQNKPWQLVHKAEPSKEQIDAGAFYRNEDNVWVYKTIDASVLWNEIMKSNYDFAEPGILFQDNINNDNNLRYVEYIHATNPCAEQPLPAYGCCDLGPINLTKFVINPFCDTKAYFDEKTFKQAVSLQVRFLDNVLDYTYWPLKEQSDESASKRRIGVGFTGLGNALAMLCIPYNNEAGYLKAADIAKIMRDAAYQASVELAKERGSFPLFDSDKYLEEGTFASRLPDHIKSDIRKYGIRNSHLLSVAPTGTVSLAFADNASNGIEPPFSFYYTRKKRNQDGTFTYFDVFDHGFNEYIKHLCKDNKELADGILECVKNYSQDVLVGQNKYKLKDILPNFMITAMEMSAVEHMKMLEVVQPYIDSSISKTVNVPEDYPFDDFKGIYDAAWKSKLKGIATYRPNNILGSVLSLGKPKENKINPDYDPLTSIIEIRKPGALNSITKKIEYVGCNGKNTLYTTVSFETLKGYKDSKEFTVERPIEIFIVGGFDDIVPGEWVDSTARNYSILARTNFNMFARCLKANRNIRSDKGAIRSGKLEKSDGTLVPMFHDSINAVIAFSIQEILIEKGLIDKLGNTLSGEKNIQVKDNTEISNMTGKKCTECGAYAVIKKDGCEYCTSCGAQGSCG